MSKEVLKNIFSDFFTFDKVLIPKNFNVIQFDEIKKRYINTNVSFAGFINDVEKKYDESYEINISTNFSYFQIYNFTKEEKWISMILNASVEKGDILLKELINYNINAKVEVDFILNYLNLTDSSIGFSGKLISIKRIDDIWINNDFFSIPKSVIDEKYQESINRYIKESTEQDKREKIVKMILGAIILISLLFFLLK